MKIKEIYERHPLRPAFLLLYVCLLPTMVLRDFSPSNELRYLSIADEALRDGSIFTFTNHGIPYADKPPLYIWLIMLCKLVFGCHNMFALSFLFSFVPSLVIVATMDRWLRLSLGENALSPSARIAFSLMLGSCGMFVGTAIFLRMDMLMCMFIVLSIFSFYKLYEGVGNQKVQSFLFPLFIFMALFTKGPVGLLMPPVTVICFLLVKKKFKDIGKYLGWKTWGVIAGLSVLWLSGVYAEGGMEYIENLLFHQTVGRAVNAFTHHKPVWYYFATIWLSVAPYCLLIVGALVASFFGWKKTTIRDTESLFVCAILSTLIMLSSFSSKLMVYLVPIIPFMAGLLPLVHARLGNRAWMNWAAGIQSAVLAVVGIVGLVGLVFFNGAISTLLKDAPYLQSWAVGAGLSIILVGSLLSILACIRKQPWYSCTFFLSSFLLVGVFFASAVMEKMNEYTAYGAICKEVPQGSQVATLFLHRPENIDVYIGREIFNYDKDIEAFLEHVNEIQAEDGPLTLITKSSKLARYSALADYFSEEGATVTVGPYCLKTYYPE